MAIWLRTSIGGLKSTIPSNSLCEQTDDRSVCLVVIRHSVLFASIFVVKMQMRKKAFCENCARTAKLSFSDYHFSSKIKKVHRIQRNVRRNRWRQSRKACFYEETWELEFIICDNFLCTRIFIFLFNENWAKIFGISTIDNAGPTFLQNRLNEMASSWAGHNFCKSHLSLFHTWSFVSNDSPSSGELPVLALIKHLTRIKSKNHQKLL